MHFTHLFGGCRDSTELMTDFPPRTHEEHVRLAYEYRNLATEKERKAFHIQHGVRWSELVRLPYFDMVRMGIIDPMHNLLLGKHQHTNTCIIGLESH